MAQSLVKNYLHIIFSTKLRTEFIDKKIENELFLTLQLFVKIMIVLLSKLVEQMIIFTFC